MASAPEPFPMGTPGNVGEFAFAQGSPGYPLPAVAGPALNKTPVSPLAATQAQELTYLVPATPLTIG